MTTLENIDIDDSDFDCSAGIDGMDAAETELNFGPDDEDELEMPWDDLDDEEVRCDRDDGSAAYDAWLEAREERAYWDERYADYPRNYTPAMEAYRGF